ncbi:hypothetical protein CLPUN_52290 [Clostridium puniceum]|uniref:Cyclic lactone autoinducer peptide n=1 Tax=Clostridium puniceum TaxID=29367 RepID=A0A1S8SYF8_9CLOT|nr:cyclic lactone autoinducer peptide [Clostridium puniceum]OOM70314.1 hypothetical protein CLPUN_52290 [Clostridium puniceum]
MENKIKKSIVVLVSNLCTKMALSVSASACLWNSYQPKEPKCLEKWNSKEL